MSWTVNLLILSVVLVNSCESVKIWIRGYHYNCTKKIPQNDVHKFDIDIQPFEVSLCKITEDCEYKINLNQKFDECEDGEANPEAIDNCLEEQTINKRDFIHCLAAPMMYCDFDQLYSNGACEKHDNGHAYLSTLWNLIVHDSSLKFGDISRYKMEKQTKQESSNLNVLGEGYNLYELDGPCSSKYAAAQSLKNMELSPIFASYIVSFVLLVIVFLFYMLNKISMGKFWILFSLLSIISYVIMIVLVFTLSDLSSDVKNNMILVYLFLETAVYIWLVIICMELYLSLKSTQNFQILHMTRYILYCCVCIIVSALYTFIVWSSADGEVEPYLFGRIHPESVTNLSTIKYMEVFGLAEILMKCITVAVAVGIAFIIKMNWKNIEDKDAKVETSKASPVRRMTTLLRTTILGLIVIGSLVFNIILYLISTFDRDFSLCSSSFYWIEYFNPLFEYLKSLNGLFIFMYIFLERDNFKLLKETFCCCFYKPKEKPTRSSIKSIVDITHF